MINNTQDLSKFGYRELDEVGTLLKAYADNPSVHDGSNDEDYNVAMMNGDTLEQWFNCPVCGHEGFLEDMYHNKDDEECQEYLEDIGALD